MEQPLVEGLRNALMFPLQGLPVPVWVGSLHARPHVIAWAHAHAIRQLYLLDVTRLRKPGPVARPDQDVTDLMYATRVVVTVLRAAPEATAIFVADEFGGKWANALAFCILRWGAALAPHVAERLLVAAARHRFRVVDGRIATCHILGEPDQIELLMALKHRGADLAHGAASCNMSEFFAPVPVEYDARWFNVQGERIAASTPCLTRIPEVGLRCTYELATLHQFTFQRYKPSGWACGSIALYACIMSQWFAPRLWRSVEIDSIIMCGLWLARRYTGPQDGQAPVDEQAAALCPELRFRARDVTDSLDGTVGWAAKLAAVDAEGAEARFILTALTPGAASGHIMFVMHQNGYWLWLEPMRCSAASLDAGAVEEEGDEFGGMLRTFDSLYEIGLFAERTLADKRWVLQRLVSSRWSDVNVLASTVPRRVLRNDQLREVPPPRRNAPLVIEQHPETGLWQVVAYTHDDTVVPYEGTVVPFRINMMPRVTVAANVRLPRGSVLRMRARPPEHPSGHAPYGMEQSPFLDPAIWVTDSGVSVLVGARGASILPYMRRGRANVLCTPDGDLFVTAAIEIDEELIRAEDGL